MGGGCSKIHKDAMPNSQSPNKNLCTTYRPDENGIPLYNPDLPFENISINGSFQPTDICVKHSSGKIQHGNQAHATEYCHGVADGDEWSGTPTSFGSPSGKDSCMTNFCNGEQWITHAAVCCNGCCAVHGKIITCNRAKFAANNVTCCFLDYSCAVESPSIERADPCFETTDKRKTCNPFYRDLSTSKCREEITDYCTGDKLFPDQSNWMEAWLPDSGVNVNGPQEEGYKNNIYIGDGNKTNSRFMKQPCLRALARNVYSKSGHVCTWEDLEKLDKFQGLLDGAGLVWAQEVLDKVLQRFIKEFGSPIGAINQDGYFKSSRFLDFYWNLCKSFPAMCQDSLKNFCSDITPEILIERPEAVKWCGCYMQEKYYEKYSQYFVTKECSPICNIDGNIPLIDANLVPLPCQQTTCIIDDVKIKIVNSLYPDGVNFSQLCKSCGQNKISELFEGIDSKFSHEAAGGTVPLFKGGPDTFNQITQVAAAGTTPQYWYNEQKNVDTPLVVLLDKLKKSGLLPIDLKDSSTYTLVDTNSAQVTLTEDNVNFPLNGKTMTNNYITGILTVIAPGKNYDDTTYKAIGIFRYLDKDKNIKYFNPGTKSAVVTPTLNFPASSISEDASIISKFNGDNIAEYGNACQCIIPDSTILIEDAKVRNLNIVQNCGGSQCFDGSGNTIACGGNSIEQQIFSSISDSFKTFEKDLISDKSELITFSIGIMLLILIIIWLVIDFKPIKKSPKFSPSNKI